MGQFVFDYGAEAPALLEGFRKSGNYQEEIDDPVNPGTMIPNPETLATFSKKRARKYFREIHAIGVISLADIETAKQDAVDDADTRSDAFDVS